MSCCVIWLPVDKRRCPAVPAPMCVRMDGRRADGYAPATVNHRLAAISGLFGFRSMRDPGATNPVPRGKEARRLSAGERNGLLAHVARRPRQRSALRLREPQRLPRALDRDEVVALVGSLRTWRDRAIAGLMVFCGLRAGEVLSLEVTDVDIGGRWLRVNGKGSKERRVPLDVDVAGVIQTYLLAERPETQTSRLFVVAKGRKSRPASQSGRSADHLSLSPGGGRSSGWSSSRAPPHVRHCAGRSRCRSCRDAGPPWACPYRHHGALHPPRARPREGRVRCCPRASARPTLNGRR